MAAITKLKLSMRNVLGKAGEPPREGARTLSARRCGRKGKAHELWHFQGVYCLTGPCAAWDDGRLAHCIVTFAVLITSFQR